MREKFYVAVAVALLAGPGVAGDTVWRIGPRMLPPPVHASAELRARILDQPPPGPGERAPETISAWKNLIATRDGESAGYAAGLVALTGVAVSEETIAGVHVYRLQPQKVAPEHANRLFVNIHGGAWAFGGGKAATIEAVMIAAKLGIAAIAIDYRRPPDFPYPAAVDDVIAVWRALSSKQDPSQIALGGTSAGGNLTLAATRRIIDLGLPKPAALMVGTPVIDLAKAGDSRFLNEGVDNVLSWEGLVAGAAALYAGGTSLSDPELSPVYADMRGFPPAYLVSGTRDLLLSDTVVAHRMLRRAGVAAELHIYEGMAHSDYLRAFGNPESDEHFAELDAFLRRNLAR